MGFATSGCSNKSAGLTCMDLPQQIATSPAVPLIIGSTESDLGNAPESLITIASVNTEANTLHIPETDVSKNDNVITKSMNMKHEATHPRCTRAKSARAPAPIMARGMVIAAGSATTAPHVLQTYTQAPVRGHR